MADKKDDKSRAEKKTKDLKSFFVPEYNISVMAENVKDAVNKARKLIAGKRG